MNPLKSLLAIGSLSLLIVGSAGAQGWERHGRGGGGDHGERGGRQGEGLQPRGYDRGDHGQPHGYDHEARGYLGSPSPRGGFAPRGYARPDYAGYASPGRNWNRGQFLPHDYWTGQSVDPRSHRLRTPPPGYGWYGVGRDAYLVQRSTGLILDTAPGAW